MRDGDADAAAVRDHQPRSARGHELVQRVRDPRRERVPRLAVGRRPRSAAPVRELAPLLVDLRRGLASPRADVDLAPALVEPPGLDAHQLGGLARPAQVAADDLLRRQPVDHAGQRPRLLAAAVGQRRVELSLEALFGVPRGLAVADEDQAVGR
jgi:hypothetical protein